MENVLISVRPKMFRSAEKKRLLAFTERCAQVCKAVSRPYKGYFPSGCYCVKTPCNICLYLQSMSRNKFSIPILVTFVILRATYGDISVPNLNGECYMRKGDLNIGILLSSRDTGVNMLCSEGLKSKTVLQYVEAVKFAIDEINERTDLLPNITIGYVFLDTCDKDLVALARSLYFIPDTRIINRNSYSTHKEGIGFNCSDKVKSFDIIGIIGPSTSRQAVMVSSLMGLFEIPVLSTFATSDELSDKSRFEYFMRLVPPDNFQAEGIVDLLLHYNWTYVSLVYSEGSYGENGARKITKWANINGICIAYERMIPSEAEESVYDNIVEHLIQNYKAKTVVLFMSYSTAEKLFRAIDRSEVVGYFIWVGSDDLAKTDLPKAANGLFSFRYTLGVNDKFIEYYRFLTPENSSGNPWFPHLWKMHFNCKWDYGAGNDSCYLYEDVPKADEIPSKWTAKHIDGTWVYAYALDMLIKDECSDALRNKSMLHSCLSGGRLLSFMKNVTFKGTSGKISFDANGDMTGQYDILQFIFGRTSEKTIKVGAWDKQSGNLFINSTKVSWQHKENLYRTIFSTDLPESLCSKPCKRKQYKIQQEMHCCWQCLYCRHNEYVVNGSSCASCPLLSWPDEENSTECLPIIPTYMKSSDPIAITLLVIASIGIVLSIIVVSFFYKNRNTKLIKASGKELSGITFVGILMAFVTVFRLIA